MLPPMTVWTLSIPKSSMMRACTLAISAGVICGNDARYCLPVRGSIDSGDVAPKGLPSTDGQMTRKNDVLIALPGPMMFSHHPGRGSSRFDAAWLECENDGSTRIVRSPGSVESPC